MTVVDANIGELKRLGMRFVCGVLTASMLLSTAATGFAAGVGASNEPDDAVDEPENTTPPVTPDVEDDTSSDENVEYPTPLILDQSAIAFSEQETTKRVRATVTDVRFLGTLTSLEEFAAFFPSDLDLNNCNYLTEDLKQSIAQLDEATRRSYRGQAIGKLKVTEQFVWSTVFNGYDYKDYIKIDVVDYAVHDASESMGPSISCEVDITWVGPTKTTATVRPGDDQNNSQSSGVESITPSQSELQELLDAANSSNSSGSTAQKNPMEEPEEIREFLYEMYKSGGLTQENTQGYDLSYFDERLKAEGATPGGTTTDVNVDAMLTDSQTTTTTTQAQDTGFSLITTPTTDTTTNTATENTETTADTIYNVETPDAEQTETADEQAETPEGADGAVVTDGENELNINDPDLGADKAEDNRVEPPLEEEAVPLNASGEEALAVSAQQTAPESTETADKAETETAESVTTDTTNNKVENTTETQTADDTTNNKVAGATETKTQTETETQTETTNSASNGLTMEQVLRQLGAGSTGTTSGTQHIVTQSGGVVNPALSRYERKLTKDEGDLYGEETIVQTAVVEPTIDANGSVVYEVGFSVSVPESNLFPAGAAYFFGTATVPDLPDNGNDNTQTDVDEPDETPDEDKKDEDDTQQEEPTDNKDEEKPEGETPDLNLNDEAEENGDHSVSTHAAATSTDPSDEELLKNFNLKNQGPNANKIYQVRMMLNNKGNSVTTDVSANLQAILNEQGWTNTAGNSILYSVLDPRVAEIDENGNLSAKREGRTAVYTMGSDAVGTKYYAVMQLEVHGRFTLSSGEAISGDPADGYSGKLAVPMISSGSLHSLALKADGSVWGWGSANSTNALGSANGGSLHSPAPIYLRSSNGIYTPLTDAVMVSAGLNFSLALTADGHIYAWGANTRGQTGTGSVNSDTIQDPTLVKGPAKADGKAADANTDASGNLCNIVAIAAGGNHALALAADGTVYAWGEGTYGQLGVKHEDLSEKNDKGNAEGGASAAETVHYSATPVVVCDDSGSALKGIVSISAGGSISVALTASGKVYTWGDNRRGSLGQNKDPNGSSDNSNFQQDSAGKIEAYKVRNGNDWKVENTGFGGIVAVSAGGSASDSKKGYGHMVAIRADLSTNIDGKVVDSTTVFGWGQNDRGQVGDNSETPETQNEDKTNAILPTEVTYRNANTSDVRTVIVSAGSDHSLSVVRERAKDTASDLDDVYYTYGWGYDARGQLGQSSNSGQVSSDGTSGGTTSQQRTPVKMLAENIKKDSSGNDDKNYKYVTGSVGVSAGNSFSILWDEEGEVFGTGYNYVYQLGAEPTLITMVNDKDVPLKGNDSVAVPVRVGYSASQNLIYDKVWVFTTMTDEDTGETSTQLTARYAVQPDQVPVEGEEGDKEIAPNVATIPVSKLTQMDPSKDTDNLMSLTPEQYTALKGVSLQYALTLTDQQYAVVFKSGMKRYYSVGFNISERDRAVPSAADSTMLYGHTKKSEVKNLDITDTQNHQEPWEKLSKNNAVLEPTELKDVSAVVGIVEDAPDVEENGIYAGKLKVTIEDANNFATPMVCSGEDFTVALKSDGTVWAWGDNTYGQLGTGKTFEELPYAPYPMRVTGLGSRESKPVMSRLTLIKEIAAGFNHAMARTADGSVYAWGDNSRGQLGQNEDVYTVYEVSGGTAHVEVNEDEVKKLTGSCYPIQVTAGASKEDSGSNYLMGATSIAAGGYHSLATVGETGWVYTWGDNSRAQLGTGYKVSAIGNIRTYPDRVVRDVNGDSPEKKYLTSATSVAAGGWHSFAIGPFPYANTSSQAGDSTYVAAWGDNTYGQLGIGEDNKDEDGTRYGIAVAYMQQRSSAGGGTLLDSVIQIAGGFNHTAVLTKGDTSQGTGGRVLVCGDYSHGQLGKASSADANGANCVMFATPLTDDKGTTITDAVGVAAGEYHTTILRGKREVVAGDTSVIGRITESTIYTFGTNTDGQLAVPSVGDDGFYKEEQVDKTYKEVTKPKSVSGVVTLLASGGKHTVALTDKGEVFAWGKNESGQLGEMSLVDREATSQAGFDDAHIPVVSGVVNYGGNLQYFVRMETHQNGVRWDDKSDGTYRDYDYELRQNTPAGKRYTLTKIVDPNTKYTHYDSDDAIVFGGSYNIWSREKGLTREADWKNTGTEVKVGKEVDFTAHPAVINFFTINFEVSDTGGTKSDGTLKSNISAQYTVGGETTEIQTGASVWGGGKLVLTVKGQGGHVPNYDYRWTVDPDTTKYTTEVEPRWTGE